MNHEAGKPIAGPLPPLEARFPSRRRMMAQGRMPPRRRARLLYEHRVSLFSFLVAAPSLGVSVVLICQQRWALESKLGVLALELFVWWLLAMALQENVTRPLQTLANVIASLREEDYSFRARGEAPDDALGELSLEVNALADLLAEQRSGALEATALLRRVVEEIDVPVFAFDPGHTLRLLNPAGEKLLQESAVRLLGQTAEAIGLSQCFTAENASLVQLGVSSGAQLGSPSSLQPRWLLRRSRFRQHGVPHTLIVLSDVSRALRAEERSAWQRLIRVLGHELNNSLTPIKSIAGSLGARLRELRLADEQRSDFDRGLNIIEARAASLHRFMQAYRQLAQMPHPALRRVELAPIVSRVAGLETRLRIEVLPGPEITLMADPDQLEQMLINLLKNAVEAATENHPDKPANGNHPPLRTLSASASGPGATQASQDSSSPEVTISWEVNENEVILTIEDNGPGLLNPANVFVPFYTTKAAGTGIGLAFSRQIAEAHGGSIELINRTGQAGCHVRATLARQSG